MQNKFQFFFNIYPVLILFYSFGMITERPRNQHQSFQVSKHVFFHLKTSEPYNEYKTKLINTIFDYSLQMTLETFYIPSNPATFNGFIMKFVDLFFYTSLFYLFFWCFYSFVSRKIMAFFLSNYFSLSFVITKNKIKFSIYFMSRQRTVSIHIGSVFDSSMKSV